MAQKMTQQNFSLQQALLKVAEQAQIQEKITIEDLLKSLAGRGYPIILILLSLPFCQPIQIPGFSTPFGLIIIFIGLRMAFGHHLWWPQWLLKREISTQLLEKIINKSLWLVQKIQKILCKRWMWLSSSSFSSIMHGITITLLGLFLATPFPIPLSNIGAAWAILFIALGLLEDDGLFIFLGYIAAALCLVMIIFIIISIRYLAST